MNPRTFPLILLVLYLMTFFIVIPAASSKTAEQSVSDPLIRGSRFTVTITGIPNSSYYIWLPRTSSMTGEPYDQPPVIADYLENIRKDPDGGPYPIGSYQYNNGNGRTIRDDIAPSATSMSNTNYYALATTDPNGQVVVEFQTSQYTGLQSYSVKVENPESVDKDNLQVDIAVHSRKAPSIMIQTTGTTKVPAEAPPLIIIPATRPTMEVTTPLPVATTLPKTPVSTTRAGIGFFPGLCAILTAAFLAGLKH